MKIMIIYRPASDHSQTVEEYVREFSFRNPELGVDLLSIETREGANAAELYGIMSYPAMMVIKDDGQIANDWQGTPLPLMNEVAYYALG